MLFLACINRENAGRQKYFVYFTQKYFTNTKPANR